MGSWSCNVYTIPSDWYFMFLWYPDHGMYILFPLIGILCFYGILIMECIYYSLWLVFYISMGSWSWNVYTLPSVYVNSYYYVLDVISLWTISSFRGVIVVIVWWFNVQLPAQSVLITTKVVNSNPAVLDTTLCDNFFVNDLRHVGGFLTVFRFHPPMKLTAKI
jgi:hypothetical protein